MAQAWVMGDWKSGSTTRMLDEPVAGGWTKSVGRTVGWRSGRLPVNRPPEVPYSVFVMLAVMPGML